MQCAHKYKTGTLLASSKFFESYLILVQQLPQFVLFKGRMHDHALDERLGTECNIYFREMNSFSTLLMMRCVRTITISRSQTQFIIELYHPSTKTKRLMHVNVCRSIKIINCIGKHNSATPSPRSHGFKITPNLFHGEISDEVHWTIYTEHD